MRIRVRPVLKSLLFLRINMELNPLQYPIGKFAAPEIITPALRQEWIQTIADLPGQLAT